jgi:hypothetical protein
MFLLFSFPNSGLETGVCLFFGGSTYFFARRAGEGSRTLVNSLEGYGSTVELHPHGASDINSIDEYRIALDLITCVVRILSSVVTSGG